MSSSVSITEPHPESKTKKITVFILVLFLKFFVALLFLILAMAGGLATGAYFRLQSLPDVRKLGNFDPHERSEILTSDGTVLKQVFGEENRKVILLKEIPAHVRNAVLAIEDARFKQHTGIDPIGIARAVKANMDSNETVQGGSTITQQVVKNLFFTPERSYARKAAEAVLSVQVDQTFSKDQILELYLNLIYWGHNAYGIEAAAETYFGKSCKDLTIAEAAMIAGLIRGPEAFSPYRNYQMAKTRQIETLRKMVESGYITKEDAEKAKSEPIKLYGIRRGMQHPYFTTYVMDYLKTLYSQSELETKGLKIYTSIDVKAQNHAVKVVNDHLEKLKNYNIQQGALVSIDAKTGHVVAMVGGTKFGYGANEFNRAFQAQRQTGSSFKPFVYVTAFENGYTPYTTEMDSPTVYKTGPGTTWSPQNYGRNYRGAMTIRTALMASVNVVAVKVMDKVGIDKVIEMTKRLGIKSEVRPFLSSALGASEITPLEMAQAYSAFANDGILNMASPIVRIEDKNGNVILDNAKPKGKKVLDQDVVRALNHSLMAVVTGGTATAAYIPGYQVAGKTGTTSSHRDAWFMGYTPQLVTSIWVGNDTPTRMYGATGGVFCAPIWKDFMVEALKSRPAEKFPEELPLRRKRLYSKGSFVSSAEVEDEDEKKKKARLAATAAAAARARQQTTESQLDTSSQVRVRVRNTAPRAVVPQNIENRAPSGRMTGLQRSTSRSGRMEGGSATGQAAGE
ncbi:penicillin-binding protein [bacterium (Candidatus Blackallbacteria) CG17_big_fil_post_rev_8_21_14_2_50_48_46]|uniref:Penicillin-binding protein n=1 Tax=bacterium (Candidatus Blackallbacteria) CG17_big_fil_post_rev_8_21_14_2_50_48_46 TaxID=2014261 RepID=A0A2M7G481_9BACT|nr:MAG: penicillin-binding protein [bacterium (Candidatus Blackallbacteria) CG18_big_fil_WC_8_21_14_2_50_49_26]PIW16314.1 MAG: penicillin-binding protein [bacterium (Candidatus Blackallbacteria) CG17_big_fil_post_rev_8_21_14_2_50_48_46]PIW45328.1 MAG: penicillin-binding protein [bacterium (Candidatus Blackallbacteria) CG13_big_fil_rev_8_21_14_2_50_49_14]